MRAESRSQPGALTVACHVRAPLLLDPVDSKIETLRRCEAEGAIDSLLLRSWPDEVSLAEESPDHEVVERLERFERWADAHGVSVRPPFRVRTTTSLVSDDPKQVLVTPVLCLALYRDGGLVGVFPHTDGETTHTATEAIAAFRTGEEPVLRGGHPPDPGEHGGEDRVGLSDAERGPATRPDGSTTKGCPRCEGSLVNVHGILTCTGCRWHDTDIGEVGSPRAKLVYMSLLDGPASIEALETALGMKKLTLYGILRSLAERGLVEQTDLRTYRLRERAASERDRPTVRPD